MVYFVNRVCDGYDVSDKGLSVLFTELEHLGNVMLRSDDAPSRMALLLKKINGRSRQLANLIAKLRDQLSLHTICAIFMLCHSVTPFM
jgi:hypothetical protein